MKYLFHITPRLYIFIILLLIFFGYSFLVYTEGTAISALPKMSEEAIMGKLLWQKHNCRSCHQIYGLGGYLGPDLTNVISAEGKGEIFARALMMGGSIIMPNFKLSEKEINEFIAFLKYIDSTGNFPEKDAEITWYGSFHVKNKTKKK